MEEARMMLLKTLKVSSLLTQKEWWTGGAGRRITNRPKRPNPPAACFLPIWKMSCFVEERANGAQWDRAEGKALLINSSLPTDPIYFFLQKHQKLYTYKEGHVIHLLWIQAPFVFLKAASRHGPAPFPMKSRDGRDDSGGAGDHSGFLCEETQKRCGVVWEPWGEWFLMVFNGFYVFLWLWPN